MATHAHGPKDPARPTKNRHAVAKHDARGEPILVEHDAQRVLTWLGADPLRTMTSEAMRAWVRGQEPEWTPGYWNAVKARAQEALTEVTSSTAQQVKAKLLAMIDGLIPHCRTLKTGTGQGVGAGTVVLRDPTSPEYAEFHRLREKLWLSQGFNSEAKVAKDKAAAATTKPPAFTAADAERYAALEHSLPYLTEIDHGAVQGYLKLLAQLTGLTTERAGDAPAVGGDTYVILCPQPAAQADAWAKAVRAERIE